MGAATARVPRDQTYRLPSRRVVCAATLLAAVAIGVLGVTPASAVDPLPIGATGERDGDTITLNAVGEGSSFCSSRPEVTTAVPPCAVGEGAVVHSSPFLLVDITYCVGVENPPVDPRVADDFLGPNDLFAGSAGAWGSPDGWNFRYPGGDITHDRLSDPITPGTCARGFVPFPDTFARQLIWGELSAVDEAVTWQIFGPIPMASPTATPLPAPDPGSSAPEPVNASPSSEPSESPVAAPVDPAESPPGDAGVGDRAPFADAVAAPAEVSTDPIVVLQSAALAALLVFLMPFPGQLFNSTLEAHEDEVRRWFRLDRLGTAIGGIGAFWASWPGVIGFTLLATLLYGFLDPGFGLSLASLATFLGMLVGIVLVTAAFAVPAWLSHRRVGDTARLKVVPLSLLIGVGCVLLSRLTGFQPGYLYGLLIGLAFARELSATEEGRATAIGAVFMLAVALMAWLGLAALPASDAFGLTVLRTSLAALMVAGLEGVVFGLLPMRFLPGESLYSWNRVAWAALLGIGAFGFFHILINPASGYLSDTSRTPLFTVLALLAGFALLSVAFWAWFRFRAPAVP